MNHPSGQNKKRLPLVTALGWIVGSVLIVTGTSYSLFKHYLKDQYIKATDPSYQVAAIVQTGPQKEILKTTYLAELMGISTDRPQSVFHFNIQNARKNLLKSPLIKDAQVKMIPPGIIYVDYTVRQPTALLGDYENIALDEEAVLFPLSPFYPPKKLPEIYLGLPPFGQNYEGPPVSRIQWQRPLKGKQIDLALTLLKLLSELSDKGLFQICRIDVSKAFAESYGMREVVVILEDETIRVKEGKERHFIYPRYLRLTPKNYAGELGNFLKLREQLLQKESSEIKFRETDSDIVRAPDQIVDLRVPELAYIRS